MNLVLIKLSYKDELKDQSLELDESKESKGKSFLKEFGAAG